MAEQWFRVPHESGSYPDTSGGPKYRDDPDITGFSGTRLAEAPVWLVKFYGTTAIMDTIESDSRCTALTEEKALELANNTSVAHLKGSGRPWNLDELRQRFRVG